MAFFQSTMSIPCFWVFCRDDYWPEIKYNKMRKQPQLVRSKNAYIFQSIINSLWQLLGSWWILVLCCLWATLHMVQQIVGSIKKVITYIAMELFEEVIDIRCPTDKFLIIYRCPTDKFQRTKLSLSVSSRGIGYVRQTFQTVCQRKKSSLCISVNKLFKEGNSIFIYTLKAFVNSSCR